MKKLILVATFILISASLIIAQEDGLTPPVDTYELEDLSKEPNQGVWMKTGDYVFFNMFGKRHAVRINLVYNENAMVVLYPDIESAPEGAYSPITKTRYISVDVNKDDVSDMEIRLVETRGSKWGDEGLFLFNSLVQGETLPETQGLVVNPESNKKNNNMLLFSALGVGILLGILVILGLKKKPKSQ